MATQATSARVRQQRRKKGLVPMSQRDCYTRGQTGRVAADGREKANEVSKEQAGDAPPSPPPKKRKNMRVSLGLKRAKGATG